MPFFCCAHPDDIDEPVVALLEDSGCSAINIGVQTAVEETRRKVLHRGGGNAQIARALELLARSRIFVYSNIMIGLPGETERDLEETLGFCARHKADLPAIYWLRYYPGTRIVEIARRMGALTGEDEERILSSRDYLPYAISGNTFNSHAARIGNLILMSGFLPSALADLIVRKRLYRFMPKKNLLFPAIALTGWLKKLFKGKKNPFHYLSVADYARLYLIYAARLLGAG